MKVSRYVTSLSQLGLNGETAKELRTTPGFWANVDGVPFCHPRGSLSRRILFLEALPVVASRNAS
jgi:hypothetical protein